MNQEKKYDTIIIGGSYAGLAAGMALGRALRKVLIIDSGDPCNKQTPHAHNFLTNDGKTPKEITRIAKQQVQVYNTVEFLDGFVASGIKTGNGFEVQIRTGETFSANKLIFATGIKDIMPDIPGFAACWGISVIHCPYCHGYEVRHQKTGILANGDTAFELASLLSNWTTDLTLYTNGKSTLSAPQLKKLQTHNINVAETEIEHLEHQNGYIEHIIFSDGKKVPATALYARLPFVQHALQMMLHYVKEGTITLEKVVEKMCHSNAIIYQVAERGYIREGYYADLVLVDVNKPMTVTKENILYNCGWSPLENMTVPASIEKTFVNGTLVFNNPDNNYGNVQSNESVKGKRLLFDRR